MKRLIPLVLTALLLQSLVGLAFAQDDMDTVTIGLSWNGIENALPRAWEDYMVAQSVVQGEEAGLTIEWIINVADNDPARQNANIEDLINQDVDIIIARAEDSAAIGASIRAAEDAGIPFITFDRESATTPPTAHVGGDSYAQSRATSEGLAALLQADGVEGRCIELQGALTDINAVNRSLAFNEVAEETGAYEVIVQVPTEWNPELFLSGATNALQANPDANCMFVASDFAWSAVQSALEGADRYVPYGEEGHIYMATQDLFPITLAAMEEGFVDVTTTYDAFAHAQEAIRVAIAIAQGEDPECSEEGCLVAGRTATPDTVADLDNLWSREYSDDGEVTEDEEDEMMDDEAEMESTEEASS